MTTKTPPRAPSFARTPYKEAFDIDYPQEPVEGQMHVYRCASCKLLTTEINGRLEGHKADCAYRLLRAARPA